MRYFFFFSFSLLVSSCTLLQEHMRHWVETPVVRIVDIQPHGVAMTGVTLKVTLEIENPNSFEISAKNIAYHIHSDQDTVAHGGYEGLIAVAAERKKDFVVDVSLDPKIALRMMQSWMFSKKDMKVQWEVRADVETFLMDFEVKKQGQQSLLRP